MSDLKTDSPTSWRPRVSNTNGQFVLCECVTSGSSITTSVNAEAHCLHLLQEFKDYFESMNALPPSFRLSLSVPSALWSSDLAAFFAKALDHLSLAGEQVELRFDASDLSNNLVSSQNTLQALDALNIQRCIKAASPSPKHLALIKSLSVNVVKLGPFNTGRNGKWTGNIDFFRAMLHSLHRRHVDVCAVDVHDISDIKRLLSLGVLYSQGPVFSSVNTLHQLTDLPGHAHSVYTAAQKLAHRTLKKTPFQRSSLHPPPTSLPLLPQTLSHLLKIAKHPQTPAHLLLELSRADPVLAATLLARGVELYPNGQHESFTLPQAIVQFGTNHIHSLFPLPTQSTVFIPGHHQSLWAHSLQTAHWAAALCRLNPHLQLSSSFTYLAGLLHDLGRFVMLMKTPAELSKVEKSGWKTVDDLITQEQTIYGFDHAETGGALADAWHLPDALQAVISRHHQTLEYHPKNTKVERLIQLVQLADRLSVTMLHHPEIVHEEDDFFNALIGKLTQGQAAMWVPKGTSLSSLCAQVDKNSRARAHYIDIDIPTHDSNQPS